MSKSTGRAAASRSFHALRSRATPLALALSTTCALAFGGLALRDSAFAAETAVVIPAPAVDEPAGAQHSATAVFAGGCFWGVQGVFQHVRGVSNVVSGYAGGKQATAHYGQVSEGDTGHAESVQISYDPTQISYGRLLQIYFSVAHNPTELNYQGPDHGSQYRSAIFPTTDNQRRVAVAYVAQLDKAKVYGTPVVTRIEPAAAFYPAEAHHQNFLTLNPDHPYIVANDLPKVADLKRLFPEVYAPKPVLVQTASIAP